MVVDVLCRASTQGGAESQMNTATTLTTDHDRTIIAHKNEAVALQGNMSGYPEFRNNQTLSIAGKRAGLDGNRSGLFREAIRIILEMLEATDRKYPRFVIWENVPGALSSNGGKDFETVLNELLRLTGTDQFVRQRGKWGARRVRSCGLPTCQCAILGSAPTQTQSIRLLRYWRTIRRQDTF